MPVAAWYLSGINSAILWCSRPGCPGQPGRLHHKLFLDRHLLAFRRERSGDTFRGWLRELLEIAAPRIPT